MSLKELDVFFSEVNLSTARGHTYQGLLEGIRPPLTEEKMSYMKVFQAAQPAITTDEKVWAKYLGLIGRHNSEPSMYFYSSTFKRIDGFLRDEFHHD